MAESKKVIVYSPKARMVVTHLWEKDVYKNERGGEEGKPSYRVLFVLPEEDAGDLIDAVYDAAIAEWGADAEKDIDAGRIQVPWQTGEEFSARRKKDGKDTSATDGMLVFKADTQFNHRGDNDGGGVYVADEDGEQIGFAERSKVWNGQYAVIAVSPSAWKIKDRGVKFYLEGVQVYNEGERLGGSDKSSLFKPMSSASDGKGRRSRQ